MIADFHSHVLPAIDDGSKSLEQSVAMLEREAEQGIGHVVATPHFYAHHDSPERFLRRRAEAETALREVLKVRPELPKLTVGAEVYYFPGISNADIRRDLTIVGSPYVMIEMPRSPWSARMYRELAEIREKQDLIPIVAHVDRYISPFRTHHIPERLAELPVLIQANSSFFIHRGTRRMALRMLQEGRIHLLGSDCHDLTDRAPNLGEALAVIGKLGDDVLSGIVASQKELLK